MLNTRSLCKMCLCTLFTLTAARAASIVNLTTTTNGSLSLTGTTAEFLYTTGGTGAAKFLLSQGFVGYPPSSTTASYVSGSNVQIVNTGIAAGTTVTAATLDFSSVVALAMSLGTPAYEPAKSSSTYSGCSAGIGLPPGFTGNCRVDPFFVSSTSGPALLQSIVIGTASHSFGSGVDVSTVGQIDLAGLSSPTSTFLSQLGSGAPIALTWAQSVSLTGALTSATAPAGLNDNMLCRQCTVYYAVASSASQTRSLTSVFNATYQYPFTQVP